MPPALVLFLTLGWIERTYLRPPSAPPPQVDTTLKSAAVERTVGDAVVIEAEPELRHLLAGAAQKMLATKKPPGMEIADVFEGLVASGDQFLSSNADRAEILEALPQAYAVDMESAAIAQVCRAADIPLGVMRVISDSADGSAHIDFTHFVEVSASVACAETVRHALRALAC